MTRLNLLLLILLLGSATWLVQVSYESRRLYIELERQTAMASELALENERLQVDRREQATPGRTERIARERLNMRVASHAATQLVALPGAGVSHPGAAASGAAR